MNNSLIKKALPHLAAILTLILVATVYFLPQLQGKKMQQSDIIQYQGMAKESKDYFKRTGKKTLWTNGMFGGMPTYQINTVNEGNQLKTVDQILRLFGSGDNAIGRFFVGMIGFYLLLILLGVNPIIGVAGAIAFGLSTNNLILYEAGQMTKLKSITYLPLVTVGMLLAYRKNYLWGGLLFALGLGLNIYVNHVQMTYYFFLTLLIFGVAQLIYNIQQKDLTHFLKATATLVVAAAIAFGTAASNLWITYEYSKDTMRGKPILVSDKSEGEIKSSSETEGLEWNYAMQWSNGNIDFFASFIPGVAGGGSSEPVGENSPMMKDPNWRSIMQQTGNRFSLYWGKLTFTSGPIYFGIVSFLLFLIGLVLIKEPIKWWLGLGTLLIIAFSMGNTLESFNRFFFDYVPLFNKFRAPNSALSVAVFLVPLLGFLTLGKILKGDAVKEDVKKSLMIGGGIAVALCLFFALLGPSFFSFSSPGDVRYEQAGYSLEPLIATRQSLMRSDAFYCLVLVGISLALMWFYNEGKLNKIYLSLGIGALVLIDVVSIGTRYVGHEDFQNPSAVSQLIRPTPADEQIMRDDDLSYRVYDGLQNPFHSSSRASNFHQSLGGYHAAKLQRYQDIIDRHLTRSNQKVFDMLNTKYFIFPNQQQQGGAPVVQVNPGALGNAWFVNTVKPASTANQEIDALNDFDPRTEAVIHQEFGDYAAGLEYRDSIRSGAITMTSYEPNHLKYKSNSTTDRLAVFSEVWYGPNKGWQAYIDGQPVDHIRANYVLRAMKIPAGEHEIEFKFDPKSYQTGVTISWIFSSLLLLGLIGGIGWSGYQYMQQVKQEPKPEPTQKKAKPRAPKTAATKKRIESEKTKAKPAKAKKKPTKRS